MTTYIHRIVWMWRCARVFRAKAALPRETAWAFGAACYEQYAHEGFSPTDAAWEEMSYWND
jgi:hypothetical protein